MVSDDLDAWAARLQREMYCQLLRLQWTNGFHLFYGPVSQQPKLMIISLQPGAEAQELPFCRDVERFERGNFSLPRENAYLKANNRMAKKVRELVGDELKDSVAFPLIAFRARSFKDWRASSDWHEAERFCFEITSRIIKKLQPKEILVLGMQTYDMLKEECLGNLLSEHVVLCQSGKFRKSRLCLRAQSVDFSVFAIAHPTGLRISKSDWEKVCTYFKKRRREGL